MGSTRFPGKMLAPFQGRPLLEWVLTRLRRARSLDRVVLATSQFERDDPLAKLAENLGVAVFRGSEYDVLGRFAAAAQAFEATTVVRICADNPLVAPEACDLAVDSFLRERPDYAFNHIPRLGNQWPDGLGVEVLDAGLLRRQAETTADPRHREHVTAWIWDQPERWRILAVPCPEEWRDPEGRVRLDVDRPEDLAALDAAFPGLTPESGIDGILDGWRRRTL
ncbi:hypothetical protein WV31_13155 [Magnetospirillum sp. ME-1]|nr:hypothetical protein WV31_13155 [Magnetospirillum sp. ME-1]